MSELANESCEACRADAPRLSNSEIDTHLTSLDGWNLVVEDDIKRVRKVFKFRKYLEGVDFVKAIAACAEEHGHHPDILLEWGKVTVTWWSHKIKGLHKNDMVMAAKTDTLLPA